MGKIKALFCPQTAEQSRKVYLRDALMSREDHRAAAEHHKALADMYDARVARLTTLAPVQGDLV